MKNLKRLLILLCISTAIFSCQKEYSVENATGTNNANAQWEFKEAGVQFKGPVDTVAVDTIGGYKFLTINGHSTDNTSQITLQVFGADLKVGTYKTPFSLFAYSKAGSIIYQTDQTATDSFTLVISKIDSLGVTGTFSGKAMTGTNAKSIVDGKFTAAFKSTTVTTPTADSGQVVIWSKAGCGGSTSTSPITVTVNGKSGQITSFTSAEPTTCDPAGSYHLSLPVGSYPWVAKCGTDSVTGTLVITKGACTKTQVDFTAAVAGDYFPMTKNSNWSYLYDAATPADTLYTFSTGNTVTFGGKPYNIFTNTDGVSKDSSYYRKSGNTYYEYSPAASITDSGVVLNIPAFEYSFLIDNLSAGTAFVGASVSATITSNGVPLPITIVLNSTILETGSTVIVSGKTYTNVIKVKTVSSYVAGSISTPYYASEQWFSKGYGQIRYIDYVDSPFTTPTDILNLTKSQVN